jgi:pyruvate kinase
LQTNISHTITDKHKQAIHLLKQAARVYDYKGATILDTRLPEPKLVQGT